MPGSPAEPLWIELTNDTLTYLRSAMLYQMQQGVKKRTRSATDASDQVQLSDVQSVSWSYKRQRYRAIHVHPDSGKIKTHYAKNLDAAISFVETGIKSSTTVEDDKQADGEGHENDVETRTTSDGEGHCSGEADDRDDAEDDDVEDDDVEDDENDDEATGHDDADSVRASAAEHTDY